MPAALRLLPVALALAAMGLMSVAQAQDAGPARATSLSASIDGSTTYAVDSRYGGRSGGDFVTEVRPGLRLDSRSGRIVGSLSYSLGLLHHTREQTSANASAQNVQNQLNASLSAEAIEQWLYVDGAANVSQQLVSAFGQQSAAGSTLDNNNRIEVGTVSLSPYVRGVLGSAVSYTVRLGASATNGRRSIAADSSATSGSVSLSSVAGGTLIGWGLVATRQNQDYRAGRQTQSDRVSASLSFNPDADLNLTLRGGQESTDVAKIISTSYNNWGAGATWRPSPRTRAQLDFDERYFGRSWRALFEHRLASSSVQFSSTRDASSGGDSGGTAQRQTLFQAIMAARATATPDPVLREQEVRNFFSANPGLDSNSTVGGGFTNTAVTLLERHQLTMSYSATRLFGSLQAFVSDSRVIDAAATSVAQEPIKQWGYLLNASYRLTPSANLTLTGAKTMTSATATLGGNNLKSATLSLSEQIGRRTSAALAVRYSVFNSATVPYREAAIVASLSHRF